MRFFSNHIVKLFIVIAGIYVTLHIADHNLHILPMAPYVKQIAWTVFLLAGTVLLYVYLGPVLQSKPLPAAPVALPGTQTQQIKVQDYGFNRIGDIDKLLFEYKGEPAWLHFPPHTAKYVMGVAIKNTMVDAGFHITNRKAADGKPMYDLAAVQTATASFIIESVPPPPPASGKQIELSGPVLDYKLDEQGLVSGFIIGKYIVEIPKHMHQDIGPMLKAAKEISVKGYERNASDGFVNTSGLVLVKPYAVTIDKTNYLL